MKMPPSVAPHFCPEVPCEDRPLPWIAELLRDVRPAQINPESSLTISTGKHVSFVSIRVKNARDLKADQFQEATAAAYRQIRTKLSTLRHPHPVRFWNYLPGIHDPLNQCCDRYMVFNAGRYQALSEWFDGADHLPGRLPAASGVGHRENDLLIQCLSLAHPGEAIENPRQIPAFRYSTRYGPRPPCFARATVVRHPHAHERMLLVAGTASIRGEQSMHASDLPAQLEETFANLLAILGAAQEGKAASNLNAFSDIRVYYLLQSDAERTEQIVRSMFSPEVRLQLVRADICRADLLVEIEGVARLEPEGKP
jgi:chorismate lyase/3-hydroxybenzoate synthase